MDGLKKMTQIKLYNEQKSVDMSRLESLHFDGAIESEIEQSFAEYVGARYACVAKSPYDILYLMLQAINVQLYQGFSGNQESQQKAINSKRISIPSNVPVAMINSVINSGIPASWEDIPQWVGNPYTLVDTSEAMTYHSLLKSSIHPKNLYEFENYYMQGLKLIYSGNFLEKDQFKKKGRSNKDFIIYSFNPGGSLSGVGGGILVGNDEDTIAYIKNKVHSGTNYTVTRTASYAEFDRNNPDIERVMFQQAQTKERKGPAEIEESKEQIKESIRQQRDMYYFSKKRTAARNYALMQEGLVPPELDGISSNYGGWCMNASPIECLVAIDRLISVEKTNKSLDKIREKYNEAFGIKNKSGTIYRIKVKNGLKFRLEMDKVGVETGVHYFPMHSNVMWPISKPKNMSKTEAEKGKVVSIPFHEGLSTKDVSYIIKKTLEYKNA